MKEIIVTGANGFIGARVVERLVQAGWRVHALGRSSSTCAWPSRMEAALADIRGKPADPEILQGLQCHEAVIIRADAGLDDTTRRRLANLGAVCLHLAGDTRFLPADVEAQRRINVDAPAQLVRTLGSGLSYFVHVSTAYVAGNRAGVLREDEADVGQGFRNHYERSKLAGELAVREACHAAALPLAIARPSIVVNDVETGRSSALTHLNALIDLLERVRHNLGLNYGEVAGPEIRVPIDPEARPNLCPVNQIVETLVRLVESPSAAGRVYHACHPSPQNMREVTDVFRHAWNVQEKLKVSFQENFDSPPRYTEKMILRSFRPYFPYLNDRSVFDLSHVTSLIPEYPTWFGPMDPAYVRKVMAARVEALSHRRQHNARGDASELSEGLKHGS